MIFSTLNQASVLLVFIFLGVIFGFFHCLLHKLFKLDNAITSHSTSALSEKVKKNKKYHQKIIFFIKIFKKNIINLIFYLIFCVFFVFFINFFYFGKFSFILLTFTILGLLWGYKTTKDLLVFCKKLWYTNDKHERKSKES